MSWLERRFKAIEEVPGIGARGFQIRTDSDQVHFRGRKCRLGGLPALARLRCWRRQTVSDSSICSNVFLCGESPSLCEESPGLCEESPSLCEESLGSSGRSKRLSESPSDLHHVSLARPSLGLPASQTSDRYPVTPRVRRSAFTTLRTTRQKPRLVTLAISFAIHHFLTPRPCVASLYQRCFTTQLHLTSGYARSRMAERPIPCCTRNGGHMHLPTECRSRKPYWPRIRHYGAY